MVHRHPTLILMEDGKTGAGHILIRGHLKACGNGLGQGGFTCPQIPIQTDHIARLGNLSQETAKGQRIRQGLQHYGLR
ncbi:MAG: hypothetical protein FD168_1272 [Desulfobulbaceae bacterium]|nr:MAG: hypothetical protein FD168_1272 [Desulfobulbaceae bacterium]